MILLRSKTEGIEAEKIEIAENVSEADLIATVQRLNEDSSVDGILVQLPLPAHLPERRICNVIVPHKDVDGFHVHNVGQMTLNINTLLPCTALAVCEILRRLQIDTRGKHAIVCGRSKNVGLPIALMLHSDATYDPDSGQFPGFEATTTICHRNTPPEQLAYLTRLADIVVSATGVPHLIRGDMVKRGACVIDVGITRVPTADGGTKLIGDVDFEEVKKVASYITPVPGGVGPLTVAMLMKNTFQAACTNAKSNC